MNNYKVLFSLRVLKSILSSFVDSFLVLYFLSISESNILPLGIYKLVAIFAIYAVMFLARNLCKSKNRVNMIRIGIILNFIYFLTIILLKENVVKYIYLVGLLYGLEEGFYYCVYNSNCNLAFFFDQTQQIFLHHLVLLLKQINNRIFCIF